MYFQISLKDGVPIYRQIVNQVKYMVASGQLTPGAELPPIRTLAEQLLVTPNTIVKAYGQLETEGVVYKRRGAGTYIAENGSPLKMAEQRRILAERADTLLSEARQMGYNLNEVLRIIHDRATALEKQPGGNRKG
ncbi:MAG: GntR family transcriptional regulator [Candidatus Hydrogenedentes bacterium]|nr:GntR family transcriptional regulator [Candidatus Hydrogenedentota bacterium]